MSLIERVAQIYEAEDPNRKVYSAREVPGSYGAITTEWLTDILCRDTPGATVTGFSFDAPDDGSTNRRRIFVTYNDAGEEAGLPGSVFCKAAETLLSRTLLAFGAGLAETNFFNIVRDQLNIEAPRAHYAGYDPDNYASLIMLHDMEGKATFCDERTVVDWDRAASQIETLANLHARFYESEQLGSASLPFPTWPDWWAAQMGGAPQYAEYCDRAFGDSEDMMSPALYRRRAEVWPLTERSVQDHRTLPRTLLHDDVHLKNWYLTNDNRMGLADWQCISCGHWSRDFIYAVAVGLEVEDRRRWEGDLLKLYLERMAELGAPRIPIDEARHNIRRQLLSALAFWTITFRPAPGMPEMQPEYRTRVFLKRLYAAIEDHESLDAFRD